VLDVGDAGPGVPFEDRERIFDWFYQGSDAPRGKLRGSGLGLAIARNSSSLTEVASKFSKSQARCPFQGYPPIRYPAPRAMTRTIATLACALALSGCANLWPNLAADTSAQESRQVVS